MANGHGASGHCAGREPADNDLMRVRSSWICTRDAESECVVVVQRAASSVMHGSPRLLSARSTVLLNAFDRLRTLGLLG